MQPYNWDSYADMVQWNRSFEIAPECDQERLDEDAIHMVFSCLQNMLCDKEIAFMANVHEFIVGRMRLTALYPEIAQQYVFPIEFSWELMQNRIRQMVLEEGLDPVEIVDKTGVDINVVVDLYHKFHQNIGDLTLLHEKDYE